jgi:translation elongation factor EF-Tu-like GTPase
MKQIEKIGIIGHDDHGKTTIRLAIEQQNIDSAIHHNEKQTIQEHIESERGIKITPHPPLINNVYGYSNGGKSSRNKRREQKRKKR